MARIMAELREGITQTGDIVPAIALEVPIINDVVAIFRDIYLTETEDGEYEGVGSMTINGFGSPVEVPVSGTLEEIIEQLTDELDAFASQIFETFSDNINIAMTNLLKQV